MREPRKRLQDIPLDSGEDLACLEKLARYLLELPPADRRRVFETLAVFLGYKP